MDVTPSVYTTGWVKPDPSGSLITRRAMIRRHRFAEARATSLRSLCQDLSSTTLVSLGLERLTYFVGSRTNVARCFRIWCGGNSRGQSGYTNDERSVIVSA